MLFCETLVAGKSAFKDIVHPKSVILIHPHVMPSLYESLRMLWIARLSPSFSLSLSVDAVNTKIRVWMHRLPNV